MTTTALLIIDLQNDYFPSWPGARWPLAGTEAAAACAARLLAAFRAQGRPVVHVRHANASPEAPFFVEGSPGADIHASVAPRAGEPVIAKRFANCFRDTPLQAQLTAMGVDALMIAGAMSHMCIDAGTRAAADLGYACTVVHDACATRDQQFDGRSVPAAQVHTAFMAALAFAYARVSDCDTALAGLDAAG
jgi:nicotinamidase-related amidase